MPLFVLDCLVLYYLLDVGNTHHDSLWIPQMDDFFTEHSCSQMGTETQGSLSISCTKLYWREGKWSLLNPTLSVLATNIFPSVKSKLNLFFPSGGLLIESFCYFITAKIDPFQTDDYCILIYSVVFVNCVVVRGWPAFFERRNSISLMISLIVLPNTF